MLVPIDHKEVLKRKISEVPIIRYDHIKTDDMILMLKRDDELKLVQVSYEDFLFRVQEDLKE